MTRKLLELALAKGNRPRVHGNGFVQLDISDNVRLHIWGHPSIPRQKTPTPIHDHMFAFSSIVIVGSIVNQLYTADYDANHYTHHVYKAQVREGEDTILLTTGEGVELRKGEQHLIQEGEGYYMEVGAIHETIVHRPSASIIVKRGRTLAQGGPSPSVFVPINTKPDNDFHRYDMPAEDLWRIITEVIK